MDKWNEWLKHTRGGKELRIHCYIVSASTSEAAIVLFKDGLRGLKMAAGQGLLTSQEGWLCGWLPAGSSSGVGEGQVWVGR